MTGPSSVSPERQKHLASIASMGGKARASKLTPEERSQSMRHAALAQLSRLSPEQVRESARKASRAYWAGMTPEERSECVRSRVRARAPEVRRDSASKAAQRRWGQVAYAKNQNDADCLFAFIEEYIRVNRYAPTIIEMARATHHEETKTKALLQILERIERIQRHPWARGISITPTVPLSEALAMGDLAEEGLLISPLLTVDSAIDWRRIAKAFTNVALTRLTEGQIARYFRSRTVEAGIEMAEREANVLLALRFPEIYLERCAALKGLADFLDGPTQPKKGCKSCGSRYTKVRTNQRYCSERCRAREKRRRRAATQQGRLLKKQQNKRYRLKHLEKERERRRDWIANKIELRRAQRVREGVRRKLRTPSARRRFGTLPTAVTAIRVNHQPSS